MTNLNDLPYELREQIFIFYLAFLFINEPDAELSDAAIFGTSRQIAIEATDAVPWALRLVIAETSEEYEAATAAVWAIQDEETASRKQPDPFQSELEPMAPLFHLGRRFHFGVSQLGLWDEQAAWEKEQGRRWQIREEERFSKWITAQDRMWGLLGRLEELERMGAVLECRRRARA